MTEANAHPHSAWESGSEPVSESRSESELKPETGRGSTSQSASKKNQIPGLFPLFLAVLLAYMGQMILNPIIAPLSREIGLQEWHIGATISLAAIVLSLSSTTWGRVSLRLSLIHI